MDEELDDAAAEAGADAIEEAVAADSAPRGNAVEKAEDGRVALEAAAEELAAEAVIEEAAAEELAADAMVDAEASVLLAEATEGEEKEARATKGSEPVLQSSRVSLGRSAA